MIANCRRTRYEGNLQERLRLLSTRTNYPTRQENGQRYLGPPVDWYGKAPANAEVFVSRLPVDCFEDEIYDFCSRVGKVYLLRLMINFENENRGFCFVTYSNADEATAAVDLLPRRQLRKGVRVHAEISLNDCTLKVHGLDFRWKDELLEQDIRTAAKDVVNVLIRRNMSQKTLVASLQFDTHQKAAVARRKLSQIANARWGHNVKVFLWSKKLQDRNSNKHRPASNPSHPDTRYTARACTPQIYKRNNGCRNFETSENLQFDKSSLNLWSKSAGSSTADGCSVTPSSSRSERSNATMPSFSSDEMSVLSYDTNNDNDPFIFPSSAQFSGIVNLKSSTPCISSKSARPFRSSSDNDSFGNKNSMRDRRRRHRGLMMSAEFDPYKNWNTNMFLKPEASLLDLRIPFELGCRESVYASEIQNHDKNIEIILLEALEAMAKNKLE